MTDPGRLEPETGGTKFSQSGHSWPLRSSALDCVAQWRA